MLQDSHPFSGFSVDDIEAAKQFYQATLGLTVEDTGMGLRLKFASGGEVFMYAKSDHQPANFTILNFQVSDIDTTIDDLVAEGVVFELYDNPNMPQDERGVLRGKSVNMGPDIAWFKDPAGNILSVLQD